MPSNSDSDLRVFGVVLYYSLLIIISPVVTFFASKYIFDSVLGWSFVSSSVCSAVSAVLTLHIALGLFIFKAYSKPSGTGTPDKSTKQE